VEAIPTKKDNVQTIIKFLEENIVPRFGCPLKTMTDKVQYFRAIDLVSLCHKYNLILAHSLIVIYKGMVG
jgi:hypothetical protein